MLVITGDQDWAPEWALEKTVHVFSELDIPFHLFVTNRSDVWNDYRQKPLFTEGWHPNFSPNSSHGSSVNEVLDTMSELVPNARSLRTHSFIESSEICRAIGNRGVIADSNCLTDLQVITEPIHLWNGVYRFPVFLEDDLYFEQGMTPERESNVFTRLDRPGFKIVNAHPIHIALNTPNTRFYSQARQQISNNEEPRAYSGYGTRDFLERLVDYAVSRKLEVCGFESLVDRYISKT